MRQQRDGPKLVPIRSVAEIVGQRPDLAERFRRLIEFGEELRERFQGK